MFWIKLDSKLRGRWVKWLILGFLSLFITIVRLPTFWEFLWYGDENIYLAVGHGLAKGQRLYQDVWDNKPPFIYLLYWLSYKFAGVNVWGFRVLNLGFSIMALISFWHLAFNLGRDLFKVQLLSLSTTIGTVFFGLLLALGWEMGQLNAENVYMPLIILGLYFWSRNLAVDKLINYIGIGICFGLACLTKVHAVAEIGVLLYLMLWQSFESKKLSILEFAKYQLSRIGLVAGLITLPYFVLIGFYLWQGLAGILYYSLLGFGSGYVANNSPLLFGLPIFGYSDSLITNLQFRLLLLVGWIALASYLRFKKYISYGYMFGLLWLGVCFFGVMISERNYPHYLIQVFGALSMVIFLVINYCLDSRDTLRVKIQSLVSLILILNMGTMIFGGGQIVPIYQADIWNRFSQLIGGSISFGDFQRSNNPGAWDRSKILLPIIEQYSSPTDKIYLVANASELYSLSNRLSGHRQITDFQYDTSIREVYNELVANKTKLIIVDNGSPAKKEFDQLHGQDYIRLPIGGLDGKYEVWSLRG